MTEGKDSMQSTSQPWKLLHVTVAQSNFHDQARPWPSLGKGSKYLWMLTQFIIVFPSHHKYLVQSPFSSQNTLTPLPLCLRRPYKNPTQSSGRRPKGQDRVLGLYISCSFVPSCFRYPCAKEANDLLLTYPVCNITTGLERRKYFWKGEEWKIHDYSNLGI